MKVSQDFLAKPGDLIGRTVGSSCTVSGQGNKSFRASARTVCCSRGANSV